MPPNNETLSQYNHTGYRDKGLKQSNKPPHSR